MWLYQPSIKYFTIYEVLGNCAALEHFQPETYSALWYFQMHTSHWDLELFSGSNHYLSAPRSARGVKMTGRTQESIPWYVFAPIFSLNWVRFKKLQKSTKIVKKWLFFGDFLNLTQFRLNISAKTGSGDLRTLHSAGV